MINRRDFSKKKKNPKGLTVRTSIYPKNTIYIFLSLLGILEYQVTTNGLFRQNSGESDATAKTCLI